MQFIGYHGTSESSAQNILHTGVRRECLPATGQIGPGFYIAKMKGELPEWGATQATEPTRRKLWLWQTIISRITGEYHNPFLPNNAKRTILKVYTTKPLLQCKWNSMNPVDLSAMNMMLNESKQDRRQALNDFFMNRSQWLQMVIPPAELQYLVIRRDDNITTATTNWCSKESPV